MNRLLSTRVNVVTCRVEGLEKEANSELFLLLGKSVFKPVTLIMWPPFTFD